MLYVDFRWQVSLCSLVMPIMCVKHARLSVLEHEHAPGALSLQRPHSMAPTCSHNHNIFTPAHCLAKGEEESRINCLPA